MLEKTTIARPYAQAAFEYASESNSLEQWSALLNVLSSIVADKTMGFILSNPKVTEQQLQELVFELCGDNAASSEQKNFIKVLINTDRLKCSPEIRTLFDEMRSDAEGTVKVEVVSAYPLDSAQEQKISDAMAKRQGKEVSINSSVDESLIGGVVIRTGDSVIDASIRGRLNELRNSFI